MNILVAYDVNTETPAGRRRLRHVAKICLDFGQRVQFSVFECSVNSIQFDELLHRLKKTIDKKNDSLRIYRLTGKREQSVKVIGIDRYHDFDEPILI